MFPYYGKIIIMNRHKLREKLVFIVYNELLLNEIQNELLEEYNLTDDEYTLTFIKCFKDNKSDIINHLSKFLHKFEFKRLDLVEQAILIVAYIELKYVCLDKEIVMDEAINIAKKYCKDGSYRFINGVLDNLCLS